MKEYYSIFRVSPEYVSDDDAEVTPVPIPNTEVKLRSADDTWREAARESRKSLAEEKQSLWTAFFCGYNERAVCVIVIIIMQR